MKNTIALLTCLALIIFPEMIQARNHSLYNVSASPFAAHIARKTGDILTIVIEEQAQTTDDGATSEEKKLDNFDFSMDQFFLPLFDIKLDEGFTKTESDGDDPGFSMSSQKKFTGTAARSSDLDFQSTVQVRIVEIINEDQFLVKGYRTIHVNAKDTKLFVSGVIRSQDIDENNQISSKLLSDAIIEIEGQVVAEDLAPGMIDKLLGFFF